MGQTDYFCASTTRRQHINDSIKAEHSTAIKQQFLPLVSSQSLELQKTIDVTAVLWTMMLS